MTVLHALSGVSAKHVISCHYDGCCIKQHCDWVARCSLWQSRSLTQTICIPKRLDASSYTYTPMIHSTSRAKSLTACKLILHCPYNVAPGHTTLR